MSTLFWLTAFPLELPAHFSTKDVGISPSETWYFHMMDFQWSLWKEYPISGLEERPSIGVHRQQNQATSIRVLPIRKRCFSGKSNAKTVGFVLKIDQQ
jgi:hypothetical protein